MIVGAIGYNHIHDSHFVENRPLGSGCDLFLNVRTSAFFEINGVSYNVKKGTILLLSSDTPYRYKAVEETYADDWIYFHMSSEEKEKLEGDGVLFDVPMYIGNTEPISSIIRKITYEHYSAEKFHSEMENMYFSILFMKLARFISSGFIGEDNAVSDKLQRMTYLRSKIYADPISFGSVESMAEYLNMSCSGLQHSYKRFFGVTVSTDLINSRVSKAKELLSSTNLTVDKIAECCGYGCTYSFLRQFKQKCGCTPTEFRRMSM